MNSWFCFLFCFFPDCCSGPLLMESSTFRIHKNVQTNGFLFVVVVLPSRLRDYKQLGFLLVQECKKPDIIQIVKQVRWTFKVGPSGIIIPCYDG